MADLAYLTPLERTLWLLFALVLYLRLKGVSWNDSLMLPLGGVVWAWVATTVLALPLSLSSRLGSYEQAWLWVAPWLILFIVPIYVWRRVPAALLPRVMLSELVFWNVTVISVSLGGWAAGNWDDSHWVTKALVLGLAALWLWPSALALLLRVIRDRVLQFLVKLPLAAYVWVSIAFWLARSLLDRETSESFVLFQVAVRLWESFAAIEIFAVLYLVYFFFSGEEQLDIETNQRVGAALDGAIEIDTFQPVTALAIAALSSVLVTGFVWLNASSSWGVPVYCLLVLPRTLAEVLHALESAPT